MRLSHTAKRLAILGFLAGAACVKPLNAGPATTVVVGTQYRSWKTTSGIDDGSVSQGAARTMLRLRFANATDLILATSGGSSRVETGPTSSSLTGLGSITSALLLPLAQDRMLVKAMATIPSGKRELDDRQIAIVDAIGLPLLGFELRHYGTGFEGGGSVTWSLVDRPSYRLAIGGGGMVRGPYRLLQLEGDFRPAPEWAATTGLDLGEDRSRPSMDIDLTYRGFGTDKLGGEAVFEEGPELELQTQAIADRGAYQLQALLRGVLKADNTALEPAGIGISGLKVNSGDGVAARIGVDRAGGVTWRLGIVAEHDRVSGSTSQGRNGQVTGIGPRLRVGIGPSTSVEATGQYWWGTVNGPEGGSHRNLRGVSLAAQLRWENP